MATIGAMAKTDAYILFNTLFGMNNKVFRWKTYGTPELTKSYFIILGNIDNLFFGYFIKISFEKLNIAIFIFFKQELTVNTSEHDCILFSETLSMFQKLFRQVFD